MAEINSECQRAQQVQATAAPPSISGEHRRVNLTPPVVDHATQSWHGSAFGHPLPEACPFQHCSYKPKCRDTFATHMQSEHLKEPSVKECTTERVPLSDLTRTFSKIWDSRDELSTNLWPEFGVPEKRPESFSQNIMERPQELEEKPNTKHLGQWRTPDSRSSRTHQPNTQQASHAKLSLPSSNSLPRPMLKRENLARMQALETSVDLSAASPSSSFMTMGDDKTPTDSGYGSVRGLTTSSAFKVRKWSPEEICSMQVCVDENMRTLSSAKKGVDVFQSHRYIIELSQKIYSKLQLHLGDFNWISVSRAIPELIQVFSLRLGHEGSSQVNQDIMYLILGSYKLISTQLKSLIYKQFSDGRVKSPQEATSSMSVQEKMSLWGQNLAMDTMEAGSVHHSECLEDDENTLLPSVKAHTYNEVIFNSAAFEWLAESLKRGASIKWDTTQSSTMIQDIWRKILAKLPPSNNSQQYAPARHLVAFQVAWEPIAFRLKSLSENLDTEAGAKIQIGDLITVTASSDGHLQAAKARDYLKQTWSSGGLELLEVLHNVFRNCGRSFHSCNLPNSTRITACLWESELLVTLHGTASSIATCGEQLGWLASALRYPRSEGVSYNMPTITDADESILQVLQTADPVNNPQQDSADATPPFVGLKIEVQEKHKSPDQMNGLPWLQYLGRHGSSVIVEGYPTAPRPKGFPGLELTFDTLVEAISPAQVAKCDGTDRLEGSSVTLQLINAIDGVYYWEEKSSSEKLTDGNHRLKHASHRPITDPGTVYGEASRHVIRELTSSSALNEVSDVVSSAPATTPDSPSAPETSIDSAMVSIKSGSVGSERPERGGLGLHIFKDIFRRLVIIFYARAHGEARSSSKAPPCTSGSEPKQTQPKSQTSLGRPGTSQEDKRQREDDEDSERDPPRKRPKTWDPRTTEKSKFLACPFWKLNPKKHCNCFFKKMTKIAYVKQHLTRRHTSGLYCQRCFKIFEDEKNLERHLTGVPCTRDPSARLEVVSHRQSLMLSAKSKGTVEDQWYAMWHILFPTDARPASIHIDADSSQDLALFREFCQKHGLAIMLEEFQARSLFPNPNTSDTELETVLSHGMDAIFEHYRLNEPSSSSSDSQPSSNSNLTYSLQSRGQGLQVETQDSGIEASLPSSLHQASYGSRHESDIYDTQVPQNNAITAAPYHGMSYSIAQSTQQENPSDSRLTRDEPSMHLPELPWEPWHGIQMAATSPNLDALLENFREIEDA